MIAAFAAITGFCSMLAAAHLDFPAGRRFYLFGGVLIVVSGLIRIESVVLVSLSIIMAVIFMRRLFNARSLIIAFTIAGLIVLGCYSFDKIYVQASPEWHTFYTYNDTRSLIQDTPRIHQEKFQSVAAQIGWSPVDYRMFINWFISDEQTFSETNLQYLVNHIPGRAGNLIGAVLSYLYSQFIPGNETLVSYPYLLMIISAFSSLTIYSSLQKARAPLLLILLSFLILLVYLIWTIKVPPRVWYSFLATLVIFGFFAIVWSKTETVSSAPQNVIFTRLGSLIVTGLILAALILTITQTVDISKTNMEKQSDYQQVLSNLDALQAQGKIEQNALIIIPAMGIPLEWAHPITLDFPKIQVLELGWLAFSPPYRDVLLQYDSYPLLTSLYKKDNVYLMTRTNLLAGIVQFIQIHTGSILQANPIFTINYPGLDTGAYTNTVLYKLRQVK
jgi:hypothetical protein